MKSDDPDDAALVASPAAELHARGLRYVSLVMFLDRGRARQWSVGLARIRGRRDALCMLFCTVLLALLGEKGEEVVFSRPLRALRAA